MREITDKSETHVGYRVADSSGVPVASRLQILEYLSDSNRPVVFEAICEHFAISEVDGINALAARLKRMRKNGYVLFDRKNRYGLPEKMDIVVGRVVGHARGFGFVVPDKSSVRAGDDLYLHHNQMRKVLHGDRVLAKTKGVDKRGRKEGVIIEVLIEQHREIVGHFHLKNGMGFVEPDDIRFARDISIPVHCFNGAKNGAIVVARICEHPIERKHTVGEIIEVVGRDLEPGMETEIALRKHEIPHSWPDEVTIHLNRMAVGDVLIKAKPEPSRKDIRDLPLVTIDGSDAKDFDDAVYCEPLISGQPLAGWRLLVAIADVSHYVKADSAVDNEAYMRGNSVYFPNRVIPMLPEQLSNGICSLNPDEDRHCMVCDMHITNQGDVTSFEFYPALMHSQARLTYEVVNAIVVDKDDAQRQAWTAVTPHLDHLYRMSLCLRKKRDIRGTIEFEFPEPYIEFNAQKRISHISVRQRNDAHKLIEECMLAANVCAAEFLQAHRGDNAIYRNHDGPKVGSLVDLRQFISGLGFVLGGGNQPTAKDYARLVASVAHRDDIAGVVQTVLLYSLSQAVYSTDQIGHFALAFPVYCHFTSPIRRYCDLVVHRQIKQILSELSGVDTVSGKDNRKTMPQGNSIHQVGEHCSFTERRADDATRDVIAWLKAEFMQGKVGQEFDGIISGVKEFGIFVQLDEIFVTGLVHVTGLGNDYYHFDPACYQLRGERGGQCFRLGDRIRVRVVRVELSEANVDFDLVSVVACSPSEGMTFRGKDKKRVIRATTKASKRTTNKPKKSNRK